ncbi:MAG: adenosylmethionine--8-amino-7-oxononanoate transaminase [Planctomycetota bacterium]
MTAADTDTLTARDARVCWHPFTQAATEPEPLPVQSARGSSLVLEDGTELIDGISSWWSILHGHAEPALVEAAVRQMSRLDHVLFAGTTHEPAVALAERLGRIAPGSALTRCFFSDNGSTAVEVGLKMALQSLAQEGRPKARTFVTLEGGYHGDTFGSMAVGDPDPYFAPFEDLLFRTVRVAPEPGAVRDALEALGDRAAGVVLEPIVQGAAGMRVHGADLVRAVREECTARGIVMIADEVMTGFGRTGRLFACEHADVAPDVLCLAKGLTGGVFPMSVTLTSDAMYERFWSDEPTRALFHGHTFTAHPVGCAIALASLELVLGRDVPARLDAIGARIHAGLDSVEERSDVTNLRHVGGMVAFDLPAAEVGYMSGRSRALRRVAAEHGVLLRPLGNVVYALPPACLTGDECDRVARAMRAMAEAR